MNPIRINLEQLKNKTIPIGREGENEYTVVRIDCGKVFREHPQAEVSMKVKPPKGIVYPVTVERDGNEIIWTVKDYDLASKGDGQFQLTFTDGTVICKTAIGRTLVLKSLEGNGPAPTPIDDWMQEAQEALDAVEDAEVNQPIIGVDGYWYTWNQEAGEYQKTDTKAEGQDGHTPVLTSSKSGKTTTIYADGDQLAQIQDGQDANIDDTSTAADKVWSAAKSNTLLSALQVMQPNATASDVGKALIVKTVENGKPSSYEYKKASVSPSDVAQQVTEWLDENVPTGQTLVVDESLSIYGAAADSKVTGAIDKRLKDSSEVYSTETSINLFNPTTLTGAGWTYNPVSGEYVGTPYQIRTAYDYILPLTFEEKTQYCLYFKAYCEGNEGTANYGIKVTITLSDGNTIVKKIANNQSTKVLMIISSYSNMSNRSVSSIKVSYESYGNNTWHLSDVMLVKNYVDPDPSVLGDEDNNLPDYVPYGSIDTYTAKDNTARANKLNKNLGSVNAGKILFVDDDGDIVAKEQGKGISNIDVLLYRDKIPSYFLAPPADPTSFDDDSYVDNKITKIPEGKQMLFFTDTHWESNAKNGIPIMQYVRGRTGIRNVLYGGDFIDRRSSKYLAKQTLTDFTSRCMAAFGEDMFTTIGNHDTNMANYTGDKSGMYLPFTILHKAYFDRIKGKIYTQADLDYEKIAAMTENADDLKELLAYFSTIYYYDDEAQKIRYIVVNTGNNQYGAVQTYVALAYNQEMRIQYDFVDYALQTVPTGWDVILFGHDFAPWDTNAFAWHDESRIMFDMLGRRKMKRSNTITIPDHATLNTWYGTNSYEYDYSDLPDIGKCIVIFGHTHRDAILNTYYNNDGYIRLNQPYDGNALNQDETGKIPLICTTTDAYAQAMTGDYSVPMEFGTITEQAFDIFTITETQLKATRFGAGSDRVVTF